MQDYRFAERPAPAPGGPLVFAFHGTGGDETQLLGLAGALLPSAHVIAPRGDVSEGGAARFFRRTGEGVYDMADLDRATRKMADFVAAQSVGRGERGVAGIGYSNGANILASLLFARPGLMEAAVLLHPLIPFTPAPQPGLAGKRILITAGERDPICPPDSTRTLADWLRNEGAAVETFWHPGGHELRAEELDAAQRFLAAATRRVENV